LLTYCRTLGGCRTGEAKITPGFMLPARWVIHTVGPVWHGGRHGEAQLLRSCYQSSFALALANQARSIAFPGISTGVYGYPKDQAAAIALEAMLAHEDRFERIIACCFSESDAELYRRELVERKG
jgi:O-acetyl-ADP-ribose deacetylase (regulator of RNase III)